MFDILTCISGLNVGLNIYLSTRLLIGNIHKENKQQLVADCKNVRIVSELFFTSINLP